MSASAPPVQGTRAGPREWIGLAVLAIPTLILSIDVTVLLLALPQLTTDLAPNATEQLWITDIYGFMIAGALVTMGTLGDRIGRRKLLLIGAAAFGTASAVAAFSTSPTMLILARALMGLAGATLMPSTLSLISTMFQDERQRGQAIGLWMSSFMGGLALGPLFGGVVLEFFSWGAVFLVNVPIMVLLLVTGPVLLPEARNEEAGRLDVTSSVLYAASILPVIYGVKELASDGWSVLPVVVLVAGLVLGAAFFRRQRRIPEPLVDLSLFRNRSFATASGGMLLSIMAMSAIMLFITQYLQMVAGLSPFEAGLWMLPSVAGMFAASSLAPWVARFVRPAYVIGGGLAISVVGVIMIASLQPGDFAMLIVGFTLIGFGSTPLQALGTDIMIGAAPEEKAGSAASIAETSGELGGALGIATLGVVGVAVYRGAVTGTIPPGTPPEAAEAARDTIATGTEAAAGLPGGGNALVAAVQQAFTTGMSVAAGVSAVFLALIAALFVALLRHLPASGTDTSGPEGTADVTADVTADAVAPGSASEEVADAAQGELTAAASSRS